MRILAKIKYYKLRKKAEKQERDMIMLGYRKTDIDYHESDKEKRDYYINLLCNYRQNNPEANFIIVDEVYMQDRIRKHIYVNYVMMELLNR